MIPELAPLQSYYQIFIKYSFAPSQSYYQQLLRPYAHLREAMEDAMNTRITRIDVSFKVCNSCSLNVFSKFF